MRDRSKVVQLVNAFEWDNNFTAEELLVVAECVLREAADKLGPVERSRPVRDMIRTLLDVQKEGL